MRDRLMTLAATPFPRPLTTWGAILLVAIGMLGALAWDGAGVAGAVSLVLMVLLAFVIEKRLRDYVRPQQETEASDGV